MFGLGLRGVGPNPNNISRAIDRTFHPSPVPACVCVSQEEEDAACLALLRQWRQALPPTPQTPVLPETQHLLARAFRAACPAVSSPLLRLLVLLLRNDSVMDMTARQEVL